jgi:hypothetical protein
MIGGIMNVTVTHRPHIRAHRSTAIAVLTIAAAVALVLVLSIQPSTTPPVTTHVEAIGAAETSAWNADVPKNRSRAFLAILRGETPAAGTQELPAPLRKSARTPWLSGGSGGEHSR